jgi:hypothetical protein
MKCSSTWPGTEDVCWPSGRETTFQPEQKEEKKKKQQQHENEKGERKEKIENTKIEGERETE